jgi:uncharacterized protein YecT (DUF1311 family)
MKIVHIVLAVAFILGGNAAFAATACDNASDHAAERVCLQQEAAKSDAKVKDAQAKLLEKIHAWREDSDFKNDTLARFQVSVGEYFKWRSAQCEYVRSVAAGGNGAGDMALECQIELDSEYLHSIHQFDGWFEGK